jgi:hypothetical protein
MKVANLCMERKHEFVFDWEEKAFQMIIGRRD